MPFRVHSQYLLYIVGGSGFREGDPLLQFVHGKFLQRDGHPVRQGKFFSDGDSSGICHKRGFVCHERKIPVSSDFVFDPKGSDPDPVFIFPGKIHAGNVVGHLHSQNSLCFIQETGISSGSSARLFPIDIKNLHRSQILLHRLPVFPLHRIIDRQLFFRNHRLLQRNHIAFVRHGGVNHIPVIRQIPGQSQRILQAPSDLFDGSMHLLAEYHGSCKKRHRRACRHGHLSEGPSGFSFLFSDLL